MASQNRFAALPVAIFTLSASADSKKNIDFERPVFYF